MSSTLANNQGTDYRRSLTNPYWQIQDPKDSRPTLTSDGESINGPAVAIWIPPRAPEGKVYHYILLPASEEGAMATNDNDIQLLVNQEDETTSFSAEDSQTAWGELKTAWDAAYPSVDVVTVIATPTWIPGDWTDYCIQVEAEPQWEVEANQSGTSTEDPVVKQTIDGDGAVEVYGFAKSGSGETSPAAASEWTFIEEIPLSMEGTRRTLSQDVGDCQRVCVVLRAPLVSKVFIAYGTL